MVFTFDQLGYGSAVSFLKFWPMALIAIGVAKMSYSTRGGGAFAGLIFTLVGVWLQAEALGWPTVNLRDVSPIVR